MSCFLDFPIVGAVHEGLGVGIGKGDVFDVGPGGFEGGEEHVVEGVRVCVCVCVRGGGREGVLGLVVGFVVVFGWWGDGAADDEEGGAEHVHPVGLPHVFKGHAVLACVGRVLYHKAFLPFSLVDEATHTAPY